jgi:SOS response regulatory protein OraA/RecX
MKYPNETAIIYNKMKSSSSLTDEQLTTLGVTKDKISKALLQCTSSGMSLEKAMQVVIKLWNNAEPEDETE